MDFKTASLLAQTSAANSVDAGGMRTRSIEQRQQELQEATQAFEAIFLNQMMKTSRQSSLGNDLFASNAVDQAKTMLDEKRADALAASSNFGIAEALYNQFAPHAGLPKIKD